jgi:hypothetical protein
LFEIKLQEGVRCNHKFGRFLEARKAMNLNMMSKEQGVELRCLLFLHEKPTASTMLSFKDFLSICERKVHFEPFNSYKNNLGNVIFLIRVYGLWLLLVVRKRMQEEVMSTVIFLGIGFKLLSSPGW